MKRSFSRISVASVAIALIVVPMLVQALRLWFRLPLPYGEVFGSSDPDSWLRLTLVREWMQGGSWYSHAVSHSDAPFGNTISPWTRPLDVVIAFFTSLEPESVDLSLRLMRTALLLPALWMGLLLAGIFRALRPFTDDPAAPFFATALVALSPPMRNYFGTANADHHAFLAVVFIWAIGGLLRPNPSLRTILLSGALLGLQLWISPEAFPLIGGIYTVYGIRWLENNRAAAAPLLPLTYSVAATSLLALMIERPPSAWLTPFYDTLSVVQVFPLGLTAVLTTMLWTCWPRRFGVRLLLAGLSIACLLLAVWRVYPLTFAGPLAGLDPFIADRFMKRIAEAQPLSHQTWRYILGTVTLPLLAFGSLLADSHHQRDMPHRTALGLLMSFAFALFLWQVRFYYYLYPLATLPAAAMLAGLFNPTPSPAYPSWAARWLHNTPPFQQCIRRVPLTFAILLLPLGSLIRDTDHAPKDPQADACSHAARQLIQGGALNHLTRHAAPILFASTNLGGEILFFTPNRIVASNYHREGAGIRYLWTAEDIYDITKLHTYLEQRRIDLLLLCPSSREGAPNALDALQHKNTLPTWLTRIDYPPLPVEAPQPEAPSTTAKKAAPSLFLVRRSNK